MSYTLRALAIAGVMSTLACSGENRPATDTANGATSTTSAADLTGAGATFPYPIYRKWIEDYTAKTGIKINYQAVGSGGGVRQISEQTVDFGASDSPMTDEELATAKGGAILHIPMVLGADVITYNVPGITQPLKFDGAALASIFLGTIKKWNDPRLAQLNAGVKLPAEDIIVVHRSDGSGTTFIFTDYLATVSKEWETAPGRGKMVNFPVGLGGKGNDGVAGQVKQTPGTLGYVELAYAKQNNLPIALIKNSAGKFIEPTVTSINAAAAGAAPKINANSDYRISIVNAPGDDAYPIASFTWILLYKQQKDAVKGKKLVDFLRWALTEGGPAAAALDYGALPSALVQHVQDRLNTIQVGPTS